MKEYGIYLLSKYTLVEFSTIIIYIMISFGVSVINSSYFCCFRIRKGKKNQYQVQIIIALAAEKETVFVKEYF
jgi:hypothetical protein